MRTSAIHHSRHRCSVPRGPAVTAALQAHSPTLTGRLAIPALLERTAAMVCACRALSLPNRSVRPAPRSAILAAPAHNQLTTVEVASPAHQENIRLTEVARLVRQASSPAMIWSAVLTVLPSVNKPSVPMGSNAKDVKLESNQQQTAPCVTNVHRVRSGVMQAASRPARRSVVPISR